MTIMTAEPDSDLMRCSMTGFFCGSVFNLRSDSLLHGFSLQLYQWWCESVTVVAVTSHFRCRFWGSLHVIAGDRGIDLLVTFWIGTSWRWWSCLYLALHFSKETMYTVDF